MTVKCEVTNYGFTYGSLTVERVCDHKGSVIVLLETPKQGIQVRVTKTGKVRLFGGDGKEYRIEYDNE